MIKFIKNINWKRNYNSLLIQYQTIANKKINELEEDREILLQNIRFRDEIEKLKEENDNYKRKYGNLEGGDKSDKDKSKR